MQAGHCSAYLVLVVRQFKAVLQGKESALSEGHGIIHFFFSVVFIVEGNRHSCGFLMGWGVGYGGSEGHKCFSHFFSPMKAGDEEGKA